MTVPELIARKLLACQQRRGRPKAGTDWRDLAVLLLAFPELRVEGGPVLDRLKALNAGEEDPAAWRTLVHEIIEPELDEELVEEDEGQR